MKEADGTNFGIVRFVYQCIGKDFQVVVNSFKTSSSSLNAGRLSEFCHAVPKPICLLFIEL